MTATPSALQTGTVGEAMTAGVLTCLPATPLPAVARLMATHRIHAVVVFDTDDTLRPWGVISDLDLVGSLDTGATAGEVAGSPVVTVTVDHSLSHAARLMREHATSHLIVVGDEDAPIPIGVLSTLDVARVFAGAD